MCLSDAEYGEAGKVPPSPRRLARLRSGAPRSATAARCDAFAAIASHRSLSQPAFHCEGGTFFTDACKDSGNRDDCMTIVMMVPEYDPGFVQAGARETGATSQGESERARRGVAWQGGAIEKWKPSERKQGWTEGG